MLKQPFQVKYWLKHEQMNKQMTFSINGGKNKMHELVSGKMS